MLGERLWKPLALIALVALSYWGLSSWRYAVGLTDGKMEANRTWQAEWAQRDKADATARANRERVERIEERRRQYAMTKVKQNADQQMVRVKVDADRVAADAQRLRGAISRLRRQLADRGACTVPGTGGGGQTGVNPRLLLTDVLNESIRRNEALAAYADRARTAGLACEKAYNEMTKK